MSTTLTFSSSIASVPTGGSSYLWESSKDGSNWTTLSSTTNTLDTSALTGEFIRVTVDSAAPLLGFMSTAGAPVHVDPPTPSGEAEFNVAFSTTPDVLAKDPGDYNVARLDPTGLTGVVDQQVIEANPETSTPRRLVITNDGNVVYTVVENPDGSFEVSDANGQKTTLIGFDGVALGGQTFNLHLDIYDGNDSELIVEGTPWRDALVVDLAVDPGTNYTWLDANGGKSLTDGTNTLVVIAPGSTSGSAYQVTVTAMGTGGAEQIYHVDSGVESLAVAHNGAPVAGKEQSLIGANPPGTPQNGVFEYGYASDGDQGTAQRDWLYGSSEVDTLSGGASQDVFEIWANDNAPEGVVWGSENGAFGVNGADVITDFKAGEQDIIMLKDGFGDPLALDSNYPGDGSIPSLGYALVYGTVGQSGQFTPEFGQGTGTDTLIIFSDESTGMGGVLVKGVRVVETDINRPYAEAWTYDDDQDGIPEVEGNTVPNANVSVYDGSQALIATAVAGVGGDYSIEVSGSASATYVVSAVDSGGQKVQPDLYVTWSSADTGSGGGGETGPSVGDGLDVFVDDRDDNGRAEFYVRADPSATVAVTAPDAATTTFTATADGNGGFSLELPVAPAPVAGTYTVSDGTSSVDVLLGTGGLDDLTGTSAQDFIFAGNDNDTVNAGAGDDFIVFSRGNDVINGGADFDTLELSFDPSAKTIVRDLQDSAGVIHLQTYEQGVGFVDAFTVNPGTTAGHTLVTAVNGGHEADLVNVERIAMGDFEHVLVPSLQQDGDGYPLQLGTRRDDSLNLTVNFDTGNGYLDDIPDVDGGEGKDTLTITFNGGSLTYDSLSTYSDFVYRYTHADSSQTEDLIVSYTAPWSSVSPGSPAQEDYISVGSLGDFYSVETLILQGSGQTPSFTVHLADLQRKSDYTHIVVENDNDIVDYDVENSAWLSATKALVDGFRVLDGKGGSDRLVGTDIDDVNEKDHLMGGQGDDSLEGRGGYNLLDGGEGRDEASYEMAERGVKVDIFRTDEQHTGVSHDTILNVENLFGSAYADNLGGNGWSNALDGNAGHDELFGGRGHDTLLGGDGHDFLDGGIGNDTLNGGKGSDVLKGGVGADTFVFDVYDFDNSVDIDTILDFNSFADQIKVINAGSAATLEYDNATGELLYDADGDDPTGAAQVIATMEAGLGLSEAHWVL